MNLGESIYHFRTARNMSQGDLADALDVSRQSVSKWENNMAVPELDKLLKMSELFGVSLDTLVRGEAGVSAPPPDIPQTPNLSSADAGQKLPPRKIAGIILLCMAFLTELVCTALGGMLEGLVFASPFLLCGLICFLFRRNVGLWCAWTVFAIADIYLSLATGVSRGLYSLNNIRSHLIRLKLQVVSVFHIIVPLVLILILLLLFIVTLFHFRKMTYTVNRRHIVLLAGGWIVWAVLPLFLRIFAPDVSDTYEVYRFFSFLSAAVDWIRIFLFTLLSVRTLAILRTLRKPK